MVVNVFQKTTQTSTREVQVTAALRVNSSQRGNLKTRE